MVICHLIVPVKKNSALIKKEKWLELKNLRTEMYLKNPSVLLVRQSMYGFSMPTETKWNADVAANNILICHYYLTMTIVKGQRLNPKGRPKGSVNITTLEKRGLIDFIKEEGKDQFLEELKTLKGMDYCKIFKDVIEIAFPKQARVDTNITGEVQIKINDYAGASGVQTKKLPTTTP
jgi:hypothetical protein